MQKYTLLNPLPRLRVACASAEASATRRWRSEVKRGLELSWMKIRMIILDNIIDLGCIPLWRGGLRGCVV